MNCPVHIHSQKKCSVSSGFTLVETLVALGTLGLFFAAIAIILQLVLQNIGESRVRTTALALAQDRMELVQNLPYANVGTAGGIPQGTLPQTENIDINSQTFSIKTDVSYIDDPFDATAPADSINTDYKRVRVEVTWSGAYPSRTPVTLVTNIAPKGVETVAGGGTLFVQVFNSQGEPVENASIAVDNTAVIPEIHLQTLSNSNGLVVLPGAPACVTCYQIVVTKNGFSTDKTYSTSEVANPLQPYATIIEGSLTPISFAIDQTSTIKINTYGSKTAGYPPTPNVFFTIRGSKIVGYDTADNPVYKYSFNTNSGGGTVTILQREWDTYTLDFANSAHNLAGSNPVNPFALTPATILNVDVVAVPKSNTTLLVVVNNAAHELLASASARLTNSGFGYDILATTSATGSADFGQVFFGSLTSSTYNLLVYLSGYQDATASMVLNSNYQQTVTLNLP